MVRATSSVRPETRNLKDSSGRNPRGAIKVGYNASLSRWRSRVRAPSAPQRRRIPRFSEESRGIAPEEVRAAQAGPQKLNNSLSGAPTLGHRVAALTRCTRVLPLGVRRGASTVGPSNAAVLA